MMCPAPSASLRRHLFTALAIGVVACASMTGAKAQVDQIEGAWQQVESNAGLCPGCRISIDQGNASWMVTANNGWTARIIARPNGDAAGATGVGRWNSGLTGGFAGKPFEVDFILRDQRLYMSMLVDTKNGSKRVVRAIYGRIWFGA
jgi:tetrahydromethanopterin S-methyltransferase subunit F